MPVGPKKTPETKDLGNLVADHLAEGLFSGRWQPGALLPKETELCAHFGVSRASVRAGMQILSSLGVIRRISGHGTVVEDEDLWNILDPAMTRWMTLYAPNNARFIKDIFMFRQAAEPYISAVAARTAKAADLLAIEQAFEGMSRTVALGKDNLTDSHGKTFSEYDVDFHAAIYRATHNIVWSRLVHILWPALHLVVRTSNATAEELRDSLNRHQAVMEAIRLRRPEESFDAARHVMARTAYDLDLEAEAAVEDPLLGLWKGRLGLSKTAGGSVPPKNKTNTD